MLRRASTWSRGARSIMWCMKMPALLARNSEELPGVSGIARIDKNTRRLLDHYQGDLTKLNRGQLCLHPVSAATESR